MTYEELIFMVEFGTGLDVRLSGVFRDSERPRATSGGGSIGSEERPNVGLRACKFSTAIRIKDQSALVKTHSEWYLEMITSMLKQWVILMERQVGKLLLGLTSLATLIGCVSGQHTC